MTVYLIFLGVKVYQTCGFPLLMKGIDVFLLLFLVDLQRRFGNIDEKYTSEIKGEFVVDTINLKIAIR